MQLFLDYLSEAVIEILKEFSEEKRPLTPALLSRALASRRDVLLRVPQALAAQGTSLAAGPDYLSSLLAVFKRILLELHPISPEEFAERSSNLHQRVETCRSIETFLGLSDEIVSIIRHLVSRTIEEQGHTSDLLTEFSNHLCGMENQLHSYDALHKETYRSNDRFRVDLLSHTEEMQEAFDSKAAPKEARRYLASQLQVIKAAIEVKHKEDESRLKEADIKIAELRERLQLSQEEISQAKERTRALEEEVLLDSLTGIHNRRAYEIRIREEFRRFHRDGQTFSLLLIDVDHFKQVNDRFGHRAGDRCLREVANRVKSSIRTTDFLARYGGEEFTVVLAGASANNAYEIAEKIRSVIEKTRFFFQDQEIPVTISLGVSEVSSTDLEPPNLFERVDAAMYRAKREGRNRVCRQ